MKATRKPQLDSGRTEIDLEEYCDINDTFSRGCHEPLRLGTYNTFALERHADEICAALGMDPLAYRRRNALDDRDLGATGQVFQGDVLVPMLDRLATLRAAKPSAETAAIE